MSHLIILPVLVPLAIGSLLLLVPPSIPSLTRSLGFFSCAAMLGIALALFQHAAGGEYWVYPLGNWPVPFDIVLVLDRLAAMMLVVTAILALAAYLYALRGWDERGAHFHALFQFQLMGVNGAFLTGDIFNLFVFFEILLIASYGLLLHGGGAQRYRAGLHYVVLNVAGSALFLIGIGLIYGVTGTLNLADLQLRFAGVAPQDRGIANAGSMLLLIVFALKAAAFPLYFWLPGSYAAACAPVAALFSIMTKVGVYAILRVHVLTFGADVGHGVDWPRILLVIALVTVALATLAALAARSLRGVIANLTVASVGTLLIAVALASREGLSAALYYLVHSTFAVAALFLLAELIGEQRGKRDDALEPGPVLVQPTLLGVLFITAAVALAGLPPLSGFLAKVNVLLAARDASLAPWVWGVILGASALTLITLARAGSQLFWKTVKRKATDAPVRAPFVRVLAVSGLLASLLLLSVYAGSAWDFAGKTAAQLADPKGYRTAVLGSVRGVDSVRPYPLVPREKAR